MRGSEENGTAGRPVRRLAEYTGWAGHTQGSMLVCEDLLQGTAICHGHASSWTAGRAELKDGQAVGAPTCVKSMRMSSGVRTSLYSARCATCTPARPQFRATLKQTAKVRLGFAEECGSAPALSNYANQGMRNTDKCNRRFSASGAYQHSQPRAPHT